ncbi:MBL fold metallo-hydrolase [Halobacillus sp. A5]|uniref:MBL fold metallo-hydrolase n=1 Tax=Halobacillus sp. A5 TaxID=2880263 RepID=UPI0020A6C130|nr:MBL fold metallo-hydrolase [Halobacillus sp. A5]MCP3027241.1 MBL fold metallo-hydrolase [Halobacillus sp. A5]
MFKNSILVFFSALLIVFMAGCGESSMDTADDQDNKETEESQEEQKSEKKGDAEEDEGDSADEKENESEEQREEADESSGSKDNNVESDGETVEESEVKKEKEKDIEKESLSSDLTAHYIDVGQADAALVEFEDQGQPINILIDAGNWNDDRVINYLHSENIDQIDIAIGTHPDADHIGQLDRVVDQFNVGEVWMSGNESTSETYDRVLESIESNGTDYVEPRAGETYNIGPLTIDLLYPETLTGDTNRESISFKMSYGEVDFVFTGDAEAEDEAQMMQGASSVDAEILQLGHHGSSTSTSQTFLDEVGPETAIYSAGEDNQYGHPSTEVVERVQEAGIDLYGTDVHGTIEVTTDGESYDVATNEDGTASPQSGPSEGEPDASEEEEEEREDTEPAGDCVDINSASVEEVQEITQIGPARAEDLVELRPYDSVDDLTKIDGIGPARIDEIKAQGIACTGG